MLKCQNIRIYFFQRKYPYNHNDPYLALKNLTVKVFYNNISLLFPYYFYVYFEFYYKVIFVNLFDQ